MPLAVAALVGVSFYYVGSQIVAGWPDLAANWTSLSVGYLVLSTMVLLLNFWLVATAWAVVFRDRDEPIPTHRAFAIIYAAQLGRYVPGKIWLFLGQVYMAEKLGYRKTTALTASALQILAGTVAAVLVMSVGLLGGGYDARLFWVSVVVGLGGLAALLLLPTRLEHIVNRWRCRRGSEPVSLAVGRLTTLKVVGLLVLAWVAHCVAFVLLARALTTFSIETAFGLAFAYNFAYLVGFYVLIAPGGIGVREGTLTALITGVLGAGLAGVMALLQRVWYLVAELVAFAIAWGIAGAQIRAAWAEGRSTSRPD